MLQKRGEHRLLPPAPRVSSAALKTQAQPCCGTSYHLLGLGLPPPAEPCPGGSGRPRRPEPWMAQEAAGPGHVFLIGEVILFIHF